jgi:hypothetical protein
MKEPLDGDADGARRPRDSGARNVITERIPIELRGMRRAERGRVRDSCEGRLRDPVRRSRSLGPSEVLSAFADPVMEKVKRPLPPRSAFGLRLPLPICAADRPGTPSHSGFGPGNDAALACLRSSSGSKLERHCKPGLVTRPRGPAATISLGRRSPVASNVQPAGHDEAGRLVDVLRRPSLPMRTSTGRGLPCRPCHHERGGLLPHRFTLAADALRRPVGGLLSVALSLGSRPAGVTRRPALWCPDFPRLSETRPRPPAPLQRGGS